MNPALKTLITNWSPAAQDTLAQCRAIFERVSGDSGIGPLDESLKWGQPAWRPKKPRTGSTVRLAWNAEEPTRLAVFVDCKTDLAARVGDLYPEFIENDRRRRMAIDLSAPFPEQAMSHMAAMTFTYHLNKRTTA